MYVAGVVCPTLWAARVVCPRPRTRGTRRPCRKFRSPSVFEKLQLLPAVLLLLLALVLQVVLVLALWVLLLVLALVRLLVLSSCGW